MITGKESTFILVPSPWCHPREGDRKHCGAPVGLGGGARATVSQEPHNTGARARASRRLRNLPPVQKSAVVPAPLGAEG